MSDLSALRETMREQADGKQAVTLQRFFKTGPGEYAEGDRFLGLRVPQLRALARQFRGLPLEETVELLCSPWHEERFMALLLLIERFRRGDEKQREELLRLYLAHTAQINNWDLVDLSAEHIVGTSLDPEDLALLERLAASESLWERRIAMMATFHFIKKEQFAPALHVAQLLLTDPHDLIRKAVGWMLREIGNRDREVEERFLRAHYPDMPRTMLRYAIERFPEPLRQQYLRGEVPVAKP